MHCLNCIRCMQNSTFETGLKGKEILRTKENNTIALIRYASRLINSLKVKTLDWGSLCNYYVNQYKRIMSSLV